jgi:hypothetical protein
MALHIAFDLLDLDGMELTDFLPGNVKAVAETERVVRQDVLIPEILGPFSHSPVSRFVLEVSTLSPCLRVATCGARFSRLRFRA